MNNEFPSNNFFWNFLQKKDLIGKKRLIFMGDTFRLSGPRFHLR